jgi:uncharacterized delta-60 repeat protein
MKKALLTTLVILGAPLTALADGDVVLDLAGNSEDLSLALAQGSDGRLYAGARASQLGAAAASATQSFLLGFDADGLPVAAFGTEGRVAASVFPAALAVRSDGSVIAGTGAIGTFSPSGVQLTTIHFCGNTPCPLGSGLAIYSLLPLPDGRVYAGGGRIVEPFDTDWALARITADGVLDSTFDDDGQKVIEGRRSISRLQALANGQFMAIARHAGADQVIGRFNVDGSTDFTFGTNGLVTLGSHAPFVAKLPLVIDSAQRMLMAGGTTVIQRRHTDGTADTSYVGIPTAAQTLYADLALDSQDRAIVFGVRNDQAYVARLLPDGGLDPSFGTGGEVVFLPSAANASMARVSAGIVDSSDRPIILMSFRSETGRSDIALMRLTEAGVIDASFGAGLPDPDARPDPFSVPSNTAPFGTTVVTSDPVTPGGYQGATSVVLTATPVGSAYSIGCTNVFVTAEGRIEPGQSICLRHTSPATPGASATTTVSIGGRAASYTTTATTTPADTTPDAFDFEDQTSVPRSTSVSANIVTISGITGAAAVSVENGRHSVGCTGSYRTTSSTITNGQTLCIDTYSSASFSTARTATIAIGGVTDTFTVTTLAEDTTPDAFTFASQSNLTQGTLATSNSITVTGTNSPAPISVSNGEFSRYCSGVFTTDSALMVDPGDTVCVRHTVAAGSNTTTLTIGGVSGTFTTSARPSGGGGSSGGGGGGGSVDGTLAALLALLVALRAGATRRLHLRASGNG